MVWLQIILFSLGSGISLFFINKTDNAKIRKFYYLIFVIISTILITAAFGFQARIDTSNIVLGFIVPSTILSIILCAEAIFISIIINKYTNVVSVFLYLPIFLFVVWIIYFITMTVVVCFYPGS
jgi:bacteriorhodopsin